MNRSQNQRFLNTFAFALPVLMAVSGIIGVAIAISQKFLDWGAFANVKTQIIFYIMVVLLLLALAGLVALGREWAIKLYQLLAVIIFFVTIGMLSRMTTIQIAIVFEPKVIEAINDLRVFSSLALASWAVGLLYFGLVRISAPAESSLSVETLPKTR